MSSVRRHRRVTTASTWAAAGAALLVHGALLGTVSAVGLTLGGGGVGASFDGATTAKEVAEAATPELKASCTGDVMLATGARYAMCLAPWNADVEGCGADTMACGMADPSGLVRCER